MPSMGVAEYYLVCFRHPGAGMYGERRLLQTLEVDENKCVWAQQAELAGGTYTEWVDWRWSKVSALNPSDRWKIADSAREEM